MPVVMKNDLKNWRMVKERTKFLNFLENNNQFFGVQVNPIRIHTIKHNETMQTHKSSELCSCTRSTYRIEHESGNYQDQQ